MHLKLPQQDLRPGYTYTHVPATRAPGNVRGHHREGIMIAMSAMILPYCAIDVQASNQVIIRLSRNFNPHPQVMQLVPQLLLAIILTYLPRTTRGELQNVSLTVQAEAQ